MSKQTSGLGDKRPESKDKELYEISQLKQVQRNLFPAKALSCWLSSSPHQCACDVDPPSKDQLAHSFLFLGGRGCMWYTVGLGSDWARQGKEKGGASFHRERKLFITNTQVSLGKLTGGVAGCREEKVR